MLAAALATVLFCFSAIAATRSARLMGGTEANFWRLALACLFLGLWAASAGTGTASAAFVLFWFSGLVGFGVGDVALFQALPRLGSRLTSLLVHCLAAPMAALAEWAWLGTRLSPTEIALSTLILGGVALALAPGERLHLPRRVFWLGLASGVLAALGQGMGAVISRRAFAVAAAAGESVDGLSAAFQRSLGGMLVAAVALLVVKRKHLLGRWDEPPGAAFAHWRNKWQGSWAWVILNALTGPFLGVGCFQWALKTTPSGIVLPIVATMPVVIIPLAVWLEGEKVSPRSLAGGLIAVAGVALLAWCRTTPT
ncbi:MAG: DMT family transporter [Verrucomicrobiae bacterium]|nr:DMT family transporter [Verrucomicrobiae bacterium]